MIFVSRLIDIFATLAGPRVAHAIMLNRLERWRTFEAEYFLLDHFVDSTRCAIDVGSNKGIYAGRLAQLTSHPVHCFEPIPWMADALSLKLQSHAVVHRCAVSDHCGSATLRVPFFDNLEMHGTSTIESANLLPDSNRFEELTCSVVRLDDVVKEPVGFMKVDVEGHEFAVLRGAERILTTDRPIILIESERRHHPNAPNNVIELLTEKGYSGFYLDRGRLRSIGNFICERDQNSANIGFVDGRFNVRGAYINNFIFIG